MGVHAHGQQAQHPHHTLQLMRGHSQSDLYGPGGPPPMYSPYYYGHEAYLDHAVEMLEPDLKPIPPQPNCPESMQVYEEHRLMAANYLEVQKQQDDMKSIINQLEDELQRSEMEMEKVAAETDNEEAKKFVQLQKEKDSLQKLRDNLSTQLKMIKTAQEGQQNQDQGSGNVERTPPTTNLDEDWVLVHGSASSKKNPD